jgi:hypothetical protein
MFWSNFCKSDSQQTVKSPQWAFPRRAILGVGVAVLLGLTACVTNKIVPLAETVGPKEAAGGFASKGMLMVYSETEDVNSGNIMYHPHTGYGIFTPEGKRVRSVVNRVGSTDQEPMTVVLPAGQYLVKARAAGFGLVSIPIVVYGGKRTMLHLEREGMPDASELSSNAVVRLPGGPPIGWRAKDVPKP